MANSDYSDEDNGKEDEQDEEKASATPPQSPGQANTDDDYLADFRAPAQAEPKQGYGASSTTKRSSHQRPVINTAATGAAADAEAGAASSASRSNAHSTASAKPALKAVYAALSHPPGDAMVSTPSTEHFASTVAVMIVTVTIRLGLCTRMSQNSKQACCSLSYSRK